MYQAICCPFGDREDTAGVTPVILSVGEYRRGHSFNLSLSFRGQRSEGLLGEYTPEFDHFTN